MDVPDAVPHAGPRMHCCSSSFLGESDDPRVQTARVTNLSEHLSLDLIGKVVASYSDVDMSQQQQISRFFREKISRHIKQGYSSDSASEAEIYAQ
jgi:hypothetical protein